MNWKALIALSKFWGPLLISLKSPLAQALLGKRTGDDIVVKLPNGRQELYIQRVSYEPPAAKDAQET